MKGELKALIFSRLALDWSPEQIAGRLKLEGIHVSHETIYNMSGRTDRREGFSISIYAMEGRSIEGGARKVRGSAVFPIVLALRSVQPPSRQNYASATGRAIR
jgi:IS30 family transposase